jgi:LysR family transcriptional regulator, glycine cleavage system transcriptional activator
LFERVHTQLVLTKAGRAYVPVPRRVYAPLHRDERPAAAHAAVVRLGVRAGITLTGPRGRLARIDAFRAAVGPNSGIVVQINQKAGLHAPIEGKVDMVIDRGVTRQPGYRCGRIAAAAWTDDDDFVVSPDGTADCPKIATLRDSLTAATQSRLASAGDRRAEATA